MTCETCGTGPAQPRTRTETAALAAAVACALGFGLANLGKPSLWHDELMHVFVARGILESGLPLLPSGYLQAVSAGFNYLLAGVVAVLGDGEFAVRLPSVLAAAANVFLIYAVARPLAGRATALAAAFALALSPWAVSWSREARFYTFQQTLYLAMTWLGWRVLEHAKGRELWAPVVLTGLVYLYAISVSFHSVLFLAPMGAYAGTLALRKGLFRSRWGLAAGSVALVVGLTALFFFLSFGEMDRLAVFKLGGLGGHLPSWYEDHVRSDRFFYLRWMQRNLSTGFFYAAVLGTGLLLLREGNRGLYAVLCFWAPVLVLTYLIGYRRPRFMFFCFPFYGVLFGYALMVMLRFACRPERKAYWAVATVVIALFAGRLGLSAVRLVGDSVQVASGADVTLARRHPQWREPCRYVRERLEPDTAVLTTTFLPVKYYVGRVDQWYPSESVWWEDVESGLAGLKSLEELAAFLKAHPRGYFIAEYRRFHDWQRFASDLAWVEEHMDLVAGACSEDVFVYEWGGKEAQ